MPAILNQGKTKIRDQIAAAVTHVGLSTDSTAFAATQTALDPAAAGTNLIKAATKANVDAETFDATISVNGSTEFTGLTIRTIGAQQGATRTDVMTRSVRTAGIGVQAGDTLTIGVRLSVQDNSA